MKSLRLITLTIGLASMGCSQNSSIDPSGDGPGNGNGNGNGNTQGLSAACPPADLFDAAICVCEDFADVGRLVVGEGPSGIASVGVNGQSSFVNESQIAGDLLAYGGTRNVVDLKVGGSLMTAGDASAVGLLAVGGDLGAGGDFSAVGTLEVGGDLRVAGQESILGSAQVGGRADFAGMDMPCACDGSAFFDVSAAVAAARDSNDNQAAGLDENFTRVGDSELRLESGTYYLADPALVGRSHITIAGDVALYVEGSLRAVGQEEVTLEPGATFDLFVSGTVATVGQVSLGSAADPQAFRLYVGGEDAVAVSVGQQNFYGSLYAPSARVAYVGDTSVVGSLFAKELTGVGSLKVAYGSPVDLDPDSCEPPLPEDEGPGDPDGDDAGDPDGDDAGDPDGDDEGNDPIID